LTIIGFIIALSPSHAAPKLIGAQLAGRGHVQRARELSRLVVGDVTKKGFDPSDYTALCAYSAPIPEYSCIVSPKTAHDCFSTLIDVVRVSPEGIVLESGLVFLSEIGRCAVPNRQ
jgi:hypothetical protein